MKKFYALYDKQLEGYRSGYISRDLETAIEESADFVCEASQNDDEPCPRDLPAREILDAYDYQVREVKKEDVDKIIYCKQNRVVI